MAAFFDTAINAKAPSIDPRLIQQASGGFLSGAMDKYNEIEANNEALRKQAEVENMAKQRLALQQKQRQDQLAQYGTQNELAQQRLGLQQDQLGDQQAKEARSAFTQQALADVYAQKTPELQRAKLAEYQQAGGFSPQATTLNALNKSWEPKEVNEVKSELFYSPKGDAVYVPKGATIPSGYLSESTYNKGLSSNGKGGSKGKGATSELAFYKAMGQLGNESSVYKKVQEAKAAGVDFKEMQNLLAAKGLYNPEVGLFELDLGSRDVDLSDLQAMIDNRNKLNNEEAKGLGKTGKGSSTSTGTSKTLKDANSLINASESMRKGLGDFARGLGFGGSASEPKGIEQGPTLKESAADIDDSNMKELIGIAKSGKVNPFVDVNASPEEIKKAKTTLREIREQDVNAFDAKYKGLTQYLYN